VSHLRNTEYLFIAADRPLAAAMGDLAAAGRTISPADA
jgi:hypothetical protein